MVDDDLDPQEKLTLEQAAERARQALSAALLADATQRRPEVLLKGVRLLCSRHGDLPLLCSG
jgi:hypothetical protein